MAAKKKTARLAHGTGVCQTAYALLREGKTNEQILAAILKKFPTSKLGMGGIGWCRNKLRKDGEKVKTNMELKKIANKSSKKKDADDMAA